MCIRGKQEGLKDTDKNGHGKDTLHKDLRHREESVVHAQERAS